MSNENENTVETVANQHLADRIAGIVDEQGNLLETNEISESTNIPTEQYEGVDEIKKNDNVDEGASENEID